MDFNNQKFNGSPKLKATKNKDFEKASKFIIPNDAAMHCSSGGDICVTTVTPSIITNGSSIENFDRSQYSDDNFEENMERAESKESDIFEIDIAPLKKENKSKLKEELCKYKKELDDYSNTTKDLKEKYMKINLELSEMQQKHNCFLAERKLANNDFKTNSDCSSTGSEYSLQRKYTQIFDRDNSPTSEVTNDSESLTKFGLHTSNNYDRSSLRQQCVTTKFRRSETTTTNRRKRRLSQNKENEPPSDACKGSRKCHDKNINDIYKVLKTVFDSNLNAQPHPITLQNTITNLQNEKKRFQNIIEQQKNSLKDYHSRCVKAQSVMKTQRIEIQKLNSNNRELETEIIGGIEEMRNKIETKLREVAELPQMMRDEKAKHDRVLKENRLLSERIRAIQAEANQLKLKMEELKNRKTTTVTRLKAAERDLKIFKNYNCTLKMEKRKLNEEMQKICEQMNSVQNCSKRNMSRQREQTEKQRRELQKRIFELEMKLNRNQSSTTSLIQERDRLICELRSQLNNLVHNFEVSQKHIRVLRKHIYSMSEGNARQSVDRNWVLNETA